MFNKTGESEENVRHRGADTVRVPQCEARLGHHHQPGGEETQTDGPDVGHVVQFVRRKVFNIVDDKCILRKYRL